MTQQSGKTGTKNVYRLFCMQKPAVDKAVESVENLFCTFGGKNTDKVENAQIGIHSVKQNRPRKIFRGL